MTNHTNNQPEITENQNQPESNGEFVAQKKVVTEDLDGGMIHVSYETLMTRKQFEEALLKSALFLSEFETFDNVQKFSLEFQMID